MELYLSISLIIIAFAFSLLAFIPIVKKIKSSNQRIYKVFSLWYIGICIIYSARLADFLLVDNIYNIYAIVFGENLSFLYLFSMTFTLLNIQYLLFMYKKTKFYTLAPIICFYISLALFIIGDVMFIFIIYIGTYLVVILYFFYKQGIKNRDNITFTIGLFGVLDIIFGYVIYIRNTNYTFIWLFTLGIILNLCNWGFFEKYLLYDREREKEIKDVWVSQMIQKAPIEKTNNKPKFVMIECPTCKKTTRKEFSPEIVEKRKNNSKGIVKIMIPKDNVCEHGFLIYVDRNFQVRGYGTADITISKENL